jgi:hypothetical protein
LLLPHVSLPSFCLFALLLLAFVVLNLTLLLGITLLLLPGIVTLLDLLASVTSPVTPILSRLLRLTVSLLGLRGNRSGPLRTLYRLTLSGLLGRLSCRTFLPILLFGLRLRLLLSGLAAVLPLITTPALSASISGKPQKPYTAHRYRQTKSTNIFFLHFSFLRIPFTPRESKGLTSFFAKRVPEVKPSEY